MEKKNKLKDAVVSSNEEVLIQDQSPKIGSTPNYGFNTFDPITDGQTKFKEFITKDSKENWVKADTKLKEINDKTDNKVTLDKVAQTNFDFIEGKVVQDGLKQNSTIPPTTDKNIQLPTAPYNLCLSTLISNTGWVLLGGISGA